MSKPWRTSAAGCVRRRSAMAAPGAGTLGSGLSEPGAVAGDASLNGLEQDDSMTIAAAHLSDTKPRVLVIDDSKDVHRLLKARLRNEQLDLSHAESGAAGLEAVQQEAPAIVLLDLDMPGMDGFEVLRRLKDDAATIHLPVIVLSGLHSSQDKVTAFDLGAVDYITKPFDLTELRVRVRSALRMHGLLQMLAQRAQLDGLTGLWNRAYFDQRWGEEVASCQRHDRPLSLAFFDADHFKSLNDTYGHPAGDQVLIGIAQIFQRVLRQTDIACRYGGEEFAIIMPETEPDEAVKVCERVRDTLENVCWERHPERGVTCSIGLCGSNGSVSVDAAAWLQATDEQLYKAKQGGRNRIAVHQFGGPGKPKLKKAG
ncbi:MAG: diguanylate cyclase [Phycisphaerales bacterium]|nr:MAG: diguanylate cyclase [Phycisphaerales bacterium]